MIRSFIREHKYFIIIIFCTLLLHIGAFFTLKTIATNSPNSLHHTYPVAGGGFDSLQYATLADNIVDYGNFSLQPGIHGDAETFRTPGYPFFVAVIKYVTGSFNSVPIFQALLFAGCALFLYLIALSISPQYKVPALVAVALFMVDPMIFFSSLFITTESVYTFLFLGSLYFVLKMPHKIKNYIISGIFLGLSTLVRPSGLYMLVPVAIWMIWRAVRKTERKNILKQGVVLLVTFILVVAPWYIRNGVRTGVYGLSSLEAINTIMFNLPMYLSYKDQYKKPIEKIRSDLYHKAGDISEDQLMDIRNSAKIKKVVWSELKPNIIGYTFFHISKSINFFFSPGLKLDASFLQGFRQAGPSSDWHPQESLVNSLMDRRWKDVFGWAKNNLLYLPESVFLVLMFIGGLYWSIKSGFNSPRLIFGMIIFSALLTSPLSNPRYRVPVIALMYLGGIIGLVMIFKRLRIYFKERTAN